MKTVEKSPFANNVYITEEVINFALKMSYLGIFSSKIWKSYCHVINQQYRICQNISCKTKQTSSFQPKMYCLCVVRREFEKEMLSYSKSARSKLFRCKVLLTKTTSNLGPKLQELGIFKLENEKNIVIFDTSTLDYFKIQSFIQNTIFSNLGLRMLFLRFLSCKLFPQLK